MASCHGGEADNPVIKLTYRDLIANFSKIVESVSRDNAMFPKILVVNAFRGYLNEFAVQQQTDDKENRAKGVCSFILDLAISHSIHFDVVIQRR